MKRIHFATGGRPGFTNDDIQILQEELYKAVEQRYSGLGSFIVSGCAVSGTSISSGLVYIDGKILPFAGASDVTFPTYIKQAAVQDLDMVGYETGGSHPKRKFYSAELVSAAPGSGEYIVMSSTGGRSYYDAISSEVVRMRGNQTIEGNKTFKNAINTDGNVIAKGYVHAGGSNGSAFRVGDDAIIADDNISNGILIKGIQDPTKGRIFLGTDKKEVYHEGNFDPSTKADKSYTDAELGKKANKNLTWTNVSYATGYSGTVMYAKDDMGFVHLKGILQNRVYDVIGRPFTLPAGFIPSDDVTYFVPGRFEDPNVTEEDIITLPMVRLRIYGTSGLNDGDIYLVDENNNFGISKSLLYAGCDVDLNGIRFYAG